MSDEIQQKYCFKHKIPLTFSLNMKTPLACCKHENYVDYVDQFSAMSLRVRYDNFPKAITSPTSEIVREIDVR